MDLSITSIAAIQAAAPAASAAGGAVAAPGFGDWFTGELQALNQQMVQAEHGVQQLATGGATNVHDVMLQLEQARLSFQVAIQVRSRVLEAYQDILRMQV